MSLVNLRIQEARITKLLASENVRRQVLERRADDLESRLTAADRRLDALYQNIAALRGAAVISLESFKETQRAIATQEHLMFTAIKESEENNDQIAANTAKLATLDAELCENLVKQSSYGQLFDLADYR